MTNDSLKNIAEKLIQKTKEKQVIWEATSGNGFKVRLSTSSIIIDYYMDTDDCVLYVLTIFNQNGIEIDKCSVVEKNINPDVLQELYECARKSHFKIEETYQSILTELNTVSVLGKAATKVDMDDLPF